MSSKNILFLIVPILILSGCTGQYDTSTSKDKKLTTTITPARDLTGTWEGIARWSDTYSPECRYEMEYKLTLTQKENTLDGTFGPSEAATTSGKVIEGSEETCLTPFQAAIIDPFIHGTVSGAEFTIDAQSATLTGTFTTDLIQGKIGGDYTGDFSFTRK